ASTAKAWAAGWFESTVITFALITMRSVAQAVWVARARVSASLLSMVPQFLLGASPVVTNGLNLEGEARAHLHIARSVGLTQRGDLAKGCRGDTGGRTGEYHVVERVESFSAEGENVPFPNVLALFQHSVEVPIVRAVDVREVTACVSAADVSRLDKCRQTA